MLLSPARQLYAYDVSDEEWTFVALYLALMRDDEPQRTYALREVFKGLRCVIRTGLPVAGDTTRLITLKCGPL